MQKNTNQTIYGLHQAVAYFVAFNELIEGSSAFGRNGDLVVKNKLLKCYISVAPCIEISNLEVGDHIMNKVHHLECHLMERSGRMQCIVAMNIKNTVRRCDYYYCC